MKRYLLPLLIGACCANASARGLQGCASFGAHDPGKIEQATRQLEAAQSRPGDERLDLADAEARLALAIAENTSRPTETVSNGPYSSADLMRDAADIWQRARPTPALAAHVQEVAGAMLTAHRCELAQPAFAAALSLSDQAEGSDSERSRTLLFDTLHVATVRGDSTTLSYLAPRWIAYVNQRTTPFTAGEAEVAIDLMALDYEAADYATAERLARRTLELLPGRDTGVAGPARAASFQLVSALYAQLRFAEAEALRLSLVSAHPVDLISAYATFTRQRDALIAQVRSGDLTGAQSKAQALLASYQADYDRQMALLDQARLDRPGTPAGTSPAASPRPVNVAQAREQLARIAYYLAQLQRYAAEILHAQGKLDEAADAYHQALSTFAHVSSVDQGEVNAIKSDLGMLERARGNLGQALALQEAVLKVIEPEYGAQHPDVLQTQGELAWLYQHTGNDLASLLLYQQHLAGARAAGRPVDELAEDLVALVELNVNRKNYDTAIEYQEQLFDACATQGASDSRKRAVTRQLAALYRRAGNEAKARRLEASVAPAPGSARAPVPRQRRRK